MRRRRDACAVAQALTGDSVIKLVIMGHGSEVVLLLVGLLIVILVLTIVTQT